MLKLKSIVLASIFSFIGIASVNAQMGEVKKTFSKVVDASADKVWTVLRKMDEIQKYSSNIARVEWKGEKGEGGQRVCYSPDGKGYFKENIVNYDDMGRSYSYSVIEGIPVKGMVNTWKVVDLGYNKSMIVWYTTFDEFLENPHMTKDQFFAFIDSSLEEMVANVSMEAKM